eukprot:6309160-Ditylum_brightwellii.AAC.1
MKLRVDAAVIAFEKTKKLCNELTCGINTSVDNYIDDDTPTTLEFEWNNLEEGHNGKPCDGEKACAC